MGTVLLALSCGKHQLSYRASALSHEALTRHVFSAKSVHAPPPRFPVSCPLESIHSRSDFLLGISFLLGVPFPPSFGSLPSQ